MICRHCGKEIEKAPGHTVFSPDGRRQIQAYRDTNRRGLFSFWCDRHNPRQGHEPERDVTDIEAIAGLLEIATDLT